MNSRRYSKRRWAECFLLMPALCRRHMWGRLAAGTSGKYLLSVSDPTGEASLPYAVQGAGTSAKSIIPGENNVSEFVR